MSEFFNLRRSAAITCSLALSACASGFSSDLRHWSAITQRPLNDQYGGWADCVEASIAQGGSFVVVLNRCEDRKGSAWSNLTYEQERRLINAAWGAYKDAEYEMRARDEAAIVIR
jgi:hypothetical protein